MGNYFMKRGIIWVILFFIMVVGGFLRFYHVSQNPPGLYVDEVSIGLNAYDILKTGKDQYGVSYPLAFRAYGEYKLPVYIYLTVGSMALFGKNDFAVRFPSAFFGTLTIGVFFFLLQVLLRNASVNKKYADSAALLGALLLAFSSWHLQFSRAGFEATVALFFYSLTLLLYMYFLKSKKFVLLLAAVCALVIPFYTYDGYKLLVPLSFAVGLGWGWLQKPIRRQKTILAAIVFILLCLPLGVFTFTTGGLARFQQTSAFAGLSYSSFWQKYLADAVIFCKNYLSYFSVSYLFRFGDQINRHQVQGFGLLYLWQLPYILLGLYFLFRTSNKLLRLVILFLLVTGPITPSLTIPSPHTLRFLYGVIPFTFLTVLGIYQLLLQKGKWVKVIIALTLVFASIQLGYYFDYYYVHYPKEALLDWGGACKQVAQQVARQKSSYQQVVIDTNIGCVSEYFSFYIPRIPITYVATTSALLQNNHATLLVTSEKGPVIPVTHVGTVLLPNLNKDTFANLWSL